MKRKIYFSMVWVSVAVMIIMATASLIIYYDFFERQVKTDIKVQADLVKRGYETVTEKSDFLSSVDKMPSDIRVSVIEPDGNVSFDTHADAELLNHHLDRPEIKAAIQKGEGEAVRYSKTLNKNTYYFALMLNDGNIIRLSGNTTTMASVFFSMLPFMLVLVLALLIVCLLIAKALTARIVKPLIEVANNLDDIKDNSNYDELNPFVLKIAKQNATITKQLEKLTIERDTITVITNNMQEGLVILSKDRYILSVNKSALSFLNKHKMDFTGQNFITLTREQVLICAADDALSSKPSDGIIRIEEKSYHYFANTVYFNNEVSGAIMLLLDVTEKQKAEIMRQEFSANVSHELKTPLTAISGYAEMIKNNMVLNNTDLIDFGGKIHSEAARLLFLIDDIMRLSQIEEGHDVGFEQVNLFAVAVSVKESLEQKAVKRGVTLGLTGDNLIVRGNSSMLYELIYNLTDNAIKYNHDNGRVDINIQKVEKYNIITISDTGIGVAKEHHDRIFERFYRVDKSRSKQTGGTGLGLSIVKHIVELHKGTLEFESEENVGTNIVIKL